MDSLKFKSNKERNYWINRVEFAEHLLSVSTINTVDNTTASRILKYADTMTYEFRRRVKHNVNI